MAGRKLKPNALHALSGSKNYRKNEPKMASGLGAPPDHLKGDALGEWNRIVPLLEAAGIGSEASRETLAAYCDAVWLYKKAKREIEEKGIAVETERGYARNPACTVMATALSHIRQYASEFGITPASIGKITVSKPEEKKGKFTVL